MDPITEEDVKKIIVSVSTNKVGSTCETELEFDDDVADDDIEEAAKDAMFDMIEWNWCPAGEYKRPRF